LVGTHLIAFCGDHGIIEVQAAGLMVTMGIFDLIGTTASGWLTDRFDPRKLLFMYYALRGLSLIYLPYSDFGFYELALFAVFYGLDWIATVPPTLKLIQENFGTADSPIIFGWVAAGHQMGAAAGRGFRRLDAFLAGQLHPGLRDRRVHRLVAAVISLLIARKGKDAAQLRPATQGA
jgi:predicted MFS family arabinose efflux permease